MFLVFWELMEEVFGSGAPNFFILFVLEFFFFWMTVGSEKIADIEENNE